ncbi:MAG: bifunctional folylpolyglutamate synthase/dihydrofolate synthase [Elusimicrobia bacterium]|nr:bifunctional folylpolyglutamate synthase/dihydrofolate synthase [Elusimicrobiota bacterium]
MTYPRALRLLAERRETRIRLGLGRLRRCLRALDDPQEALACVHVAGTNGKGSTCAILESVLRAAGYRTGLYLSPHLTDVRERIQVGGRPIAPRDFSRLLGRVAAADPRGELTYFELLTAAAFLAFREAGVRVAVLETGLGGRLDATNVVRRPLASVITSIGLDHTQWLGGTLREIAREKAGIIKAGAPVFCPALPEAARRVVAERARELGCVLSVARRPWRAAAVRWRDNVQTLDDGSRRRALSLLGAAQGRNAALAWAVLRGLRESLPVPPAAWRAGLRRVRLPGRFQVRRLGRRTVIIDGAHNAQAMGELVRTLEASPWRRRRVRWIVGLMRDKDVPAVVGRLAGRLRDAAAVAPPNPRALPARSLARELARQAPRARVREFPGAAAALRRWLREPSAPRTAVVCGSFYLAGPAAGICDGGSHA